MVRRRYPRHLSCLVGTIASALALSAVVACGSNETDGASARSSTTLSANPAANTSSAPPGSTTPPTRVPISTTLPPAIADSEIGQTLVPESTTSYDFQQETINGVAFPNALRIYSTTSPKKVEINAGRSRKRFLGSLGIPDDAKSTSVHQVEISLDNGPPVFSTVLNFGETKTIDLDVTNVLRVRITVVSKESSSSGGYLAIGNPRFV